MKHGNNVQATSVDMSAPTADWWEEKVTRREAQVRGAGLATLMVMSGLQGQGCCGSDESEDALQLQGKHGWNVGDPGTPLKWEGAQEEDAYGGSDWSDYLKPAALMEVMRPSEPWRPFESPTLVQALDQLSLAKKVKPVYTQAMKRAYARGKALASLVLATEKPEAIMMVLDMPGEMSVALATAMAHQVEPVFFFDNWPHPQGVVASHQTLGALLYYAEELRSQAAERTEPVPRALVLDSNRLAPYTSASDRFDNRYVASIPDAKALATLGVTHILYVSEITNDPNIEMDDLNGPLVALAEAGVQVASIGLDAFAKDLEVSEALKSETDGYYYGGRRRSHGFFFIWYASFRRSPLRTSTWPSTPVKPTNNRAFGARKPSYTPKARSTAFSSRTFGVRSGVGRTKPSGFGRVSVRRDSSGRVSLGKRQGSGGGRSGSFGRSRGGSFG